MMKKILILFAVAGVVAGVSGVGAVTCPLLGTCTDNSSYKTVDGAAACGSGWVEVSGVSLTITDTGSDAKGNYGYGACSG
jgi:hypothetical protein